ncbi:hypothetical protein GCM10007162_12100 [Ignatzschineria ureiclastica]|nr:hypothetical protein GCM10007162_12100 [Ignatzschineria ureiclastica]
MRIIRRKIVVKQIDHRFVMLAFNRDIYRGTVLRLCDDLCQSIKTVPLDSIGFIKGFEN